VTAILEFLTRQSELESLPRLAHMLQSSPSVLLDGGACFILLPLFFFFGGLLTGEGTHPTDLVWPAPQRLFPYE
jgi:hypothetical protein